jgi:hypothetical protein
MRITADHQIFSNQAMRPLIPLLPIDIDLQMPISMTALLAPPLETITEVLHQTTHRLLQSVLRRLMEPLRRL